MLEVSTKSKEAEEAKEAEDAKEFEEEKVELPEDTIALELLLNTRDCIVL